MRRPQHLAAKCMSWKYMQQDLHVHVCHWFLANTLAMLQAMPRCLAVCSFEATSSQLNAAKMPVPHMSLVQSQNPTRLPVQHTSLLLSRDMVHFLNACSHRLRAACAYAIVLLLEASWRAGLLGLCECWLIDTFGNNDDKLRADSSGILVSHGPPDDEH